MTTSPEITEAEIAQALDESVSNLSVARGLGIPYTRVRDVRQRLGLAPYQRGRVVEYETWEDAVRGRIVADGDHAHWSGIAHHGTPIVNWRYRSDTAYRAIFRLHYGRAPEGNVRPWCTYPRCVLGGHLEDRPMRHERLKREGAV
ncbi:hypothetical protein [Streptomyces sp. BSE6.1]|uniref:hypothetical protein n=1 Tax=Streptomyces sp. BSE6.1 TaxID=2605730 RepID=UPI001F388CFA|nr:hypothetical protein [Streptomyces sp. BSE6.1]